MHRKYITDRLMTFAPIAFDRMGKNINSCGLERLPSSLEEAVQAAQESEFLHRVLPEELSHRYYEEELKRCAALKAAADPAEYERVHYFNAI